MISGSLSKHLGFGLVVLYGLRKELGKAGR
jgi:hypothetical protein